MIGIIGSGNIAFHLINVLKNTNTPINNIFSRNRNSLNDFNKTFNLKTANTLNELIVNSKIIIIAVNDDSIQEIVELINKSNKIIIHCSGLVNLNILNSKFNNCGVLYMVQSFNKNIEMTYNNIPICLEYSNNYTKNYINKIAQNISSNILEINSKQREYIHIAAVISNNFSNLLFTKSFEILNDRKIPFNILLPLLNNTINKLNSNQNPINFQTGPAFRNDFQSIEKHKLLIKDDIELLEIYETLTKSIQSLNKSK